MRRGEQGIVAIFVEKHDRETFAIAIHTHVRNTQKYMIRDNYVWLRIIVHIQNEIG